MHFEKELHSFNLGIETFFKKRQTLRKKFYSNNVLSSIVQVIQICLKFGPRQANLVLIAYASSEGSGEPAHPKFYSNNVLSSIMQVIQICLKFGPRQANLVLIAYASSEGSGEPAHPRSLTRTSAACSYKQ